VTDKPWWRPTADDDWDEPLPEVVILAPEYTVELPLSGDGQLAWQRTKLSPALLDRLATWQAEFDNSFHWRKGWSSAAARDRWAGQAEQLATSIRAELGDRARLEVDLWPLRDDSQDQSTT
jgi:hypothetical protein